MGLRDRIVAVVLAIGAVLLAFSGTAQAGVRIDINLNAQRMTVTTPDGDVRHWAISSGRTGYRTIRGNFRPQTMKTYHWSRKYGGHMPHAIFFKGGFAIHGTDAESRLGAPASHGCIRLSRANARELFGMVKEYGARSTRIAIRGDAPTTQYAAAPKRKKQTAVARAEAKERAAAVRQARARSAPVAIPAYAPIDPAPAPIGLWRRLR
jgi:hypothetical protein